VFPTLQHASKSSPTLYHSSVSVKTDSVKLWHACMRHASFQTIKRILHHCNIFANTISSFCYSCVVSKIHQLPYVPSQTQYMHPLE